MKKSVARAAGLCAALLLSLGGCAPAQPAPQEAPAAAAAEASGTEEEAAAVSAAPEGYCEVHIAFPDNRESVGTGEDLRVDENGDLLPPARSGAVDYRAEELVTLDLLLPEGWTARLPAEGEGTYAEMLRGPVNLYRGGQCVGTVGYDRFDDEPIEAWEDYGFDAPPADYQGYYRWLMTGVRTWDDSYTLVAQTGRAVSATCRVRYPARLFGDGADYYNKGVLCCDLDLLYFTGIELLDSALTDEQLRVIADSIRLSAGERPFGPPLPVPSIETPAGFRQAEVLFPAYQEGKTDYNAEIYEHSPFRLRMALPEGWTVRRPARAEAAADLFTPMDLYDGETRVGSVGYGTFTFAGPTTGENFHRMIYGPLMLGSVVNWDNDYTPVTMTETTCTATCRVMCKADGPEWEAVSMADRPERYSPAILSYDEKLLVYVAFSFEEGLVTGEQLDGIARTIRLLPER